MLKTLFIATVLLPTLAFAQRSQQLPQPGPPRQECPVGWMASGNYCVPGSDKVRLAGAKAAVIASAEGVREGESILASPALSSDWQRRTNVWRRLTNPARRAKRLRKRGIPQAGLIRWVQIIALCLRSSRHFQCCCSHGAKEPC